MCGIVCYYGRSKGVNHVLDALDLLAYRAPDSSGIAVIGEDGRFSIRRAVGTSEQLRAKLAQQPLPALLPGNVQVIMGHGRWAMVGAVNEINAHPLSDRGRDRVACENGSHNATLMLGAYAEQEKWWRERGVPEGEPVHKSTNTTEVIAYEWERLAYQLAEGERPAGSATFLEMLDKWGVADPEERALRLAIWRLRHGNAHACAFYGRQRPETLFVTSHYKPIAIAKRMYKDGGCDLMVASDINAALMLWSKDEVNVAAQQITALQQATEEKNSDGEHAQKEIQKILETFTVEVIFLDNELHQGEELFARIENGDQTGLVTPRVQVSRYDGTPVPVFARPMRLNPAMIGKRGFASYTESHIAEIPDVMDGIVNHYIRDGQPALESTWVTGRLVGPGLNIVDLNKWFGSHLKQLGRLLLIGEGSSWRNAQAAAPLFRQLLPGVLVTVYRPVEVLNLGPAVDPSCDLAIEISWSGTTDSLLKVDSWLGDSGVKRLAVTGRTQSDLGRRTTDSAGTLDVLTGVEVSVATVKGYQAILMMLNMLALQLAGMRGYGFDVAEHAQLVNELAQVIPKQVRWLIEDEQRRARLRDIARRCQLFNKIVVVGDSPVDIEAELKIEELAQVMALASDFHAASLRPLIERCALVDGDRRRILFIINATSAEAHQEASTIIHYLKELGVFCFIHTTPHDELAAWQMLPNAEVFVSPAVSRLLQPLIDAPFFFDLAVALAYARGLTADEIDRPRNLAKSVTVTGAERRAVVEARRDFANISLAEFSAGQQANLAWDKARARPSRAALTVTTAVRTAITVISNPLPEKLDLLNVDQLTVLTDDEAAEIGVSMAAAAWQMLLGVDLTSYRHFMHQINMTQPDSVTLRLIRAGAFLAVRDANTIAVPSDLSPLQLELLSAVTMIGLAIRLARDRGVDTALWESGLARLPMLAAGALTDDRLSRDLNQFLTPLVNAGYDKVQIIGGGQDYAAAASIARSLRTQGYLAEALYTDSAWHGPLAAVGGPDADHDTLIVILATDPLFQAAALVDTQVYRTRDAVIILMVPDGNQDHPAVQGVDASAVLGVPAVPRLFLPVVNAVVGSILAEQMARLWEKVQLKEVDGNG